MLTSPFFFYERKVMDTVPTDKLFVAEKLTPLSESEATFFLKKAFLHVVGSEPSFEVLALLWAHSALEVGRWRYIHNNNWGNIKRLLGQKYTSYRCSEILKGKEVWFEPYHPQTFFAAWDTPLDGAIAYLEFLKNRKRYAKAWKALLTGDPSIYAHELKVAGYYTADEKRYTALVVKLTEEFKKKSATLLSWKPKEEPKSTFNIKDIKIPEVDFKSAPGSTDSIELKYKGFWDIVLGLFNKLFKILHIKK